MPRNIRRASWEVGGALASCRVLGVIDDIILEMYE